MFYTSTDIYLAHHSRFFLIRHPGVFVPGNQFLTKFSLEENETRTKKINSVDQGLVYEFSNPPI